jgi:hypothetical protein
MDTDGYSVFNPDCILRLNELFSEFYFEVWLSSTRRTQKTLQEFNQIFQHRKIDATIVGFLPKHDGDITRKEEIEHFIKEQDLKHFLILDDDKTLHELSARYSNRLVLTEYHKGFDVQKLEEAVKKLRGLI